MANATNDLDEVRHFLGGVADRFYPGHGPVTLVIETPLGPVVVAVPNHATGTTPQTPLPAIMTESEQEVVQVFEEAGPGAVLTAAEIARLVGCEPNTRFRETLARLVRTVVLNRAPGRAGYRLPEGRSDAR